MVKDSMNRMNIIVYEISRESWHSCDSHVIRVAVRVVKYRRLPAKGRRGDF
jgi:hypothetical protein